MYKFYVISILFAGISDGIVKDVDPLANCISILDQDHCYHSSFPKTGHNRHQNLVTPRMHNGSITSRGDRMPLKGPNVAFREQDDGFQQLNQYKLYDKIGQVNLIRICIRHLSSKEMIFFK